MHGDRMSHSEALEFSDRIRDLRWETWQARVARRRAASARRASFFRSIPASFARLVRAKDAG